MILVQYKLSAKEFHNITKQQKVYFSESLLEILSEVFEVSDLYTDKNLKAFSTHDKIAMKTASLACFVAAESAHVVLEWSPVGRELAWHAQSPRFDSSTTEIKFGSTHLPSQT